MWPRLTRQLFLALGATAFCIWMSGAAWGQGATSLRGTVTEQSGAALVGAQVVLVNPEAKRPSGPL